MKAGPDAIIAGMYPAVSQHNDKDKRCGLALLPLRASQLHTWLVQAY